MYVCVVIFAEVSREQTRCSRSGVDTIRILLNTCWLGGMRTVISACWKLHAHYYTLSCTHSITHMYEGERAPWWVSSNPAPARVPDNPAFAVIIMHTCKQTHIQTWHWHWSQTSTYCLKEQQWNRWINISCWYMFSWGSNNDFLFRISLMTGIFVCGRIKV